MTLGIKVPDYEINRRLWLNEHFEGGYLFRNGLILEMVPPTKDEAPWKVKFAWQGSGVTLPHTEVMPHQLTARSFEITVPFDSGTTRPDGSFKPVNPGLRGSLRFVVEAWNADASG